jgi:hypothetical protein
MSCFCVNLILLLFSLSPTSRPTHTSLDIASCLLLRKKYFLFDEPNGMLLLFLFDGPCTANAFGLFMKKNQMLA